MKKRFLNLKTLVACAALTTTLFGCKKASDSGDPINPAGNKQLITVTMPSEDTDVISRAGDAVAAEVAIKSAFVLIYADDAVATMPKFSATIVNENITDAEGSANGKVLSFIKDNSIVAGDIVYVVFNKELSDLNVAQGGLVEALKLTADGAGIGTGDFSNGLIDVTKGLPMCGKGVWVDDITTTVSVRRGVAKVQLKLAYVTGANHVAGAAGRGYTTENTTFKLYQLTDAGYIDGTSVATTGSEAVDKAGDNDITHQSAIMTDDFTGANYIFAYPYAERIIGASPSSLKDNKEPSFARLAVIMKNTYEGKSTYHRLDICEPSSKIYYNIVNNHHYTIKLREVGIGGYDSATKALNALPSNIKYDVIVEDEGDVVVTNGQYVLNIDTKEDKFDVAGANSKIELAKVNRVTSIDADIIGETEFKASLNGLSVSAGTKALTFKLSGVSATLGRVAKSLYLAVSDAGDGMGMAKFRYSAKLGNIVYDSTPITLNSNFEVINAKIAGETLNFKVSSTSAEWTVTSNSTAWANPINKTDTGFSVVVPRLSSAARIAEVTVSNPIGDNKQAGESIVITITQEIILPIFADRNVGTSWDIPVDDVNALCLRDNSRPRNIANWKTESPRTWFTWKESLDQCKNWKYQGKTWRQPTKEDFDDLVASRKLQHNVSPHLAVKLVQRDSSTVYFPIVGYSLYPDYDCQPYWSSSYVNADVYHCNIYTGSAGVYLSSNTHIWGLSVRCVLV